MSRSKKIKDSDMKLIKHSSRNSQTEQNECPADLTFWFKDRFCGGYRARIKADTKVSIGRTDSKRALGFMVSRGKTQLDFVLDKDQVAELAAYLRHHALGRLLKPLGRKREQMSLVALNSPKLRLHKLLEGAAANVHPGYYEDGDGFIEIEKGAPKGKALVAWFKKAHPLEAARIERTFTKRLWEES